MHPVRSDIVSPSSSKPLANLRLSVQGLLDALPAATVIVDAAGTIIATNVTWNGITAGMPASVGDAYRTPAIPTGRVTREDQQLIARGLDQVLKGEKPDYQMVYTCGDAARLHSILLNITAVPQVSGALITHQDISATKRNEAFFQRRTKELTALTAELRRTNEELDQFAYITSHDLKAPLRGIANLSRWIEEDIGPAATPEIHAQMELLRGRVHRMESLIDGLLQYSRVGRTFTRIEEIDVNKLLVDVIDLLAPPPAFRIEVQGAMPLVRGERIRLQQVFMNLIGNAIKHHNRSDGRVTITCKPVGAYYRFCVADDGPGIDPRFHNRIFVIFQTLLPRDQKEAAGVGLSLVKKIVEEQGGTVEVDSAPGCGARFYFTWARDRNER